MSCARIAGADRPTQAAMSPIDHGVCRMACDRMCLSPWIGIGRINRLLRVLETLERAVQAGAREFPRVDIDQTSIDVVEQRCRQPGRTHGPAEGATLVEQDVVEIQPLRFQILPYRSIPLTLIHEQELDLIAPLLGLLEDRHLAAAWGHQVAQRFTTIGSPR